MKNLIQVAVVTFLVASTAQAQQAVQWRVQDGGNGHWYARVVRDSRTWSAMRALAEGFGGHLATVTSSGESAFLVTSVLDGSFCFVGGFQPVDAREPAADWRWVTVEPLSWTNWANGEPNNYAPSVNEDVMAVWGDGRWADVNEDAYLTACSHAIIEWSADCNGDGIVDYGQCRDGSLTDYNGNNIPDCCEAGTPCAVGNYPVQWRTAEGGNGHWYNLVRGQSSIDWDAARSAANDVGGYLATSTSATENQLLFDLTRGYATWTNAYGPWLGGLRDPSNWTWRWVTDEPWGWTNWCPTEPNNDSCSNLAENVLQLGCGSARWNDFPGAPTGCDIDANGLAVWGYFVEWSADCNGDGIVDKGQILRGQLPDANRNGVPDGCEVATCIDADIYRDFNVNGADLGILLSQWGPNTPLTESDLNADGAVDGVDLGILLSFWGPCP